MRRPELAEACRQAKCFYFHALRENGTPETEIELMALKANFILPYTSGRKVVGWLGRMKSVKLVKRHELCRKLGIEDDQLQSDCSHYFAVDLDILDEKPPVTDVSHLVPLRDGRPKLVKWPDL